MIAIAFHPIIFSINWLILWYIVKNAPYDFNTTWPHILSDKQSGTQRYLVSCHEWHKKHIISSYLRNTQKYWNDKLIIEIFAHGLDGLLCLLMTGWPHDQPEHSLWRGREVPGHPQDVGRRRWAGGKKNSEMMRRMDFFPVFKDWNILSAESDEKFLSGHDLHHPILVTSETNSLTVIV